MKNKKVKKTIYVTKKLDRLIRKKMGKSLTYTDVVEGILSKALKAN